MRPDSFTGNTCRCACSLNSVWTWRPIRGQLGAPRTKLRGWTIWAGRTECRWGWERSKGLRSFCRRCRQIECVSRGALWRWFPG